MSSPWKTIVKFIAVTGGMTKKGVAKSLCLSKTLSSIVDTTCWIALLTSLSADHKATINNSAQSFYIIAHRAQVLNTILNHLEDFFTSQFSEVMVVGEFNVDLLTVSRSCRQTPRLRAVSLFLQIYSEQCTRAGAARRVTRETRVVCLAFCSTDYRKKRDCS